jgi:integrase
MSRHKITDGLHQRADGRWERKEKINGKMRWFSSMEPAEVWKKRDAAIAAGPEEKAKENAGPTFDEVADIYKGRVMEMKYGTQRSYLPAIKRAVKAFGKKHMREIEPYMISEFLQSMASSAKTTVSNQKTVLNAIFQTWIESPVWRGDRNPAKIVSIPRGLKHTKREPPTDDQVKIVKDHYLDLDALPAVVFLCTGERRGEACGIQLRDIDFEKKTISITKHIDHKGNQPYVLDGAKTPAGVRKIPLLKMLEESLEPLRELPPKTYILGGGPKPLTTSRYNRMWANFWHKYGYATQLCYESKSKLANGKIKKYTHKEWKATVCAHQFRHEYVCMLAEAEIPEAIAIQIVGHANAKMIHEVYMSLKPKMIEDTRAKLNALISMPTTPTKTPT